MNKQLEFIVKLFFISTSFSLLIKYVAPSLKIMPTTNNTLLAIFLPSILIGLFLLKRLSQSSKKG